MQGVRAVLWSTALSVLFLISLQAGSQEGTSAEAEVLLSSNPSEVILAYHEIPDMLENPDPTPRIRVYSSGRVVIFYPHYMKRAGTYETLLSQGELQRLLHSLAGIVDFDKEAAKAAKAKKRQNAEFVTYRSDLTLEQFDINFASYRSNPGAQKRAVKQSVKWRDLAADASDYPDVPGITELKNARAAMRSLMARNDLRKNGAGPVVKPLIDRGGE